ncbi:carboxypeptidase D-like [Cimex lectularius]|uniref:Peptidase M14 domain-containing protein n=1 Tax=Cimex lectularius TaxID=79782 RepID=A0A8I6S3J9_CIMLE|nr:carboxypeptidase D-like [Cimex lectularius]
MRSAFLLVIWASLLQNISSSVQNYHNYSEICDKLDYLAKKYYNAKLYSIGTSSKGKALQVLKIGSNSDDIPLIPDIKLIGGLHGNVPIGTEILIKLSEHLLENYGINEEITKIVDSVNIHILPSLNPDGFELAKEGLCQEGPGRGNANGADLNRNFPSVRLQASGEHQPETIAVMQWMLEQHFMLSLTLNGGALVATYPYDMGKNNNSKRPHAHLTEDDEEFKHLARKYVREHPYMADRSSCPYNPNTFDRGIVNGAQWIPLKGTMQDYNYDFHGCLELNIAISCCKYPHPQNIEKLWKDNKRALIEFIKESYRGVRGIVTHDSKPVMDATVTIISRSMEYKTTSKGEYWRYLLPGKYYLKVEKNGFKTVTSSIVIPKQEGYLVRNIELKDKEVDDSDVLAQYEYSEEEFVNPVKKFSEKKFFEVLFTNDLNTLEQADEFNFNPDIDIDSGFKTTASISIIVSILIALMQNFDFLL